MGAETSQDSQEITNFSVNGFELNLIQHEIFDNEVFSILDEKLISVITANGIFKLSVKRKKVDTHKFTKAVCIIDQDIVYGAANGDIIYLKRINIQSETKFIEKQIYFGAFSKIHQIISLTERALIVLGTDKTNNYKLCYLNANADDTFRILKEMQFKNIINGMVSVSDESLYLLQVENHTLKLIKLEPKTFNELSSLDIKDLSENQETKIITGFKNKVVISCGNKIYCYNEDKLEKSYADENTSESVSDLICISEYIIVFYKSSRILFLNSELQIMSTIDTLSYDGTLEKCHLTSNKNLCLIFKNKNKWSNKWSIRLVSCKIPEIEKKLVDENIKPSIDLAKSSENIETTTKVDNDLDDSEKSQPPTVDENIKPLIDLAKSNENIETTTKVDNDLDDSEKCQPPTVDENIKPLIDLANSSESIKTIMKVYNDLENCQPATEEEKLYSSQKLEEISIQPKPKNSDLAIMGIQKYIQSFGTELVLCESSDKNNHTNKVHANILFNGFLNSSRTCYTMELEFEGYNFSNMKDPNKNAEICEKFKNFISAVTGIPSNEIIITKIHNKNICFDFTFSQADYHEVFRSNFDTFEDLVDKDTDKFCLEKAKVKNVEINPLLKECKLNVNIFNPKFDKTYNKPFKDTRGQLPFILPDGWIRIALNIEFFGYSNYDDWIQMDKGPGEWAVAYHGLTCDPLGTLEKVIKDQYGNLKVGYNDVYRRAKNTNKLNSGNFNKPCGNGIHCVPNIKQIENRLEAISHNGKDEKLALMCRVNPYQVKIAGTDPYKQDYVIEESDAIRPYAILIKIS